MIGPQPLDNHHPLLHSIKGPGVDDNAAAPITDAHAVAVAESQSGERQRVYQRRRPTLASDARRCVVEAGVEEGSRRGRDQAKRLLGIVVIDYRDMVRKYGQLRMTGSE